MNDIVRRTFRSSRRAAVAAIAVCLFVMAGTTSAQTAGVRVAVKDDAGSPVPYALVTVGSGRAVVADTLGLAAFRVKTSDSLRIMVRRIGYRLYDGWAARGSDGEYAVVVPRLAATLEAVTVTERANTVLARTGFYDRVARVQNGAIVGEFITPEELEVRKPSAVSRALGGTLHARLAYTTPKGRGRLAIIQGRGGCAMTIVLDGEVVKGTIQDAPAASTFPTSLNPNGTRPTSVREETTAQDLGSIDDVVDMTSVVAVEIYPSTANAPFELQRVATRGNCGIVALWTGARR